MVGRTVRARTAISGSAATAAAPLVLRSRRRSVTATCWWPPTSARRCVSRSPPPTAAGPASATSVQTAVVVAGSSGGSAGTLGNTVAGSVTVRPSSNYKFGSVFVLSQPVTTVDFKFYVAGGTVAQKFKPVIYTVDGSGAPTTLVASGAEVTVAAGQAAGWVTSTLPAVALVPGSYMLALLSGPTDSGAILYYAAVSDTKAGQYNANAYPTASPSWGTTQYENHLNSFYIDYTTTTTTGPPPVNTSLPVISGSAQQGQSLTGSNGAWSNSPSSYGYQWQRCNSSGAACVAIPAAIGNSYLLVAADVGATLRFQVTATNGSGPASATSVQTAVVTAAPGSPPVNTSLPVISGTAQQGQLAVGE